MLFEEFLKGIGQENTDSTRYAYQVINRLYMNTEFAVKSHAYEHYRRNRKLFDWVDTMIIGPGLKVENTCTKYLEEADALRLINRLFAFEKDKIVICGPAYYAATDWNLIRFTVKGYPRVLWNGKLFDIIR